MLFNSAQPLIFKCLWSICWFSTLVFLNTLDQPIKHLFSLLTFRRKKPLISKFRGFVAEFELIDGSWRVVLELSLYGTLCSYVFKDKSNYLFQSSSNNLRYLPLLFAWQSMLRRQVEDSNSQSLVRISLS